MTTNTLKPSDTLTPEQKNELLALKEAFTSSLIKIMEANNTDSANLDLLKVWPETNDISILIEQLSDMKACLDSFRPFNASQMENLQEVFDTEYTYASNRIEGNTLTLQETSFVINEGLTVRNKSMKEHLEAINHNEAIGFMRELVKNQEPLNEYNIKSIHSLILQGIDRENAGTYRGVVVGIRGTDIVFPQPYIVPKMMEDLILWYEESKNKLHPVQLAAQMHSKLVNIHPFIDGNGRTCRLVMNLILLQNGYPLTIFSPEEEDRTEYFDALNQARAQENEEPFEVFVAQSVKHWTIKYLQLLAPNSSEQEKEKGYAFFKKIEPLFKSESQTKK